MLACGGLQVKFPVEEKIIYRKKRVYSMSKPGQLLELEYKSYTLKHFALSSKLRKSVHLTKMI